MVVASLRSLKFGPSVRTWQMLLRKSPEVPTSEVTEATRSCSSASLRR